MKQILRRALLCALAGAAGLYTAAAAVVQPTEARYVADYAQVLSEDTEQYIIEKNQALFSATGGEIVVVAVDFMDGMDAADYAMSVAENWGGIGDVDRANGFVLVYAVGENKVWAWRAPALRTPCPPPPSRAGWRTTSMTATTPGSTTAPPGPFLTTYTAGTRAIKRAAPPAEGRAITRRGSLTMSMGMWALRSVLARWPCSV